MTRILASIGLWFLIVVPFCAGLAMLGVPAPANFLASMILGAGSAIAIFMYHVIRAMP